MTRRPPQPQAAGVPEPPAPGPLPFISVIVPVRNEAAFIRRTLTDLLRQDYDPRRFEVLVADGQSTDATPAIVQSMQANHPNLRLLHNEGRWSSAGRNRAVEASQGDILVVIDGHCQLPDRAYLTQLAEAFRRSGAPCIGRPQPLDVRDATALQRSIAAARSCWLGHHPDSHIYADREQWVRPQSVAVAYRRWVFAKVGLFDENFDACEDVEFNHRVDRAGLPCLFTPKVGLRYHPRTSLAGLFRQMVRYGRGRLRLLRKHPETLSLACLVPALWVLGLAAGAVAAGFSPALAGIYAGTVSCYVLVVMLVSLRLAIRERDPRLLGWLPLVFAAIHGGAGVGLLQEAAVQLTSWETGKSAATGWQPRRRLNAAAGAVPGK
jgi:succinoglycan biosynthesis protein ExoA